MNCRKRFGKPDVCVHQRQVYTSRPDRYDRPGDPSEWIFPILPFQHRPDHGHPRWLRIRQHVLRVHQHDHRHVIVIRECRWCYRWIEQSQFDFVISQCVRIQRRLRLLMVVRRQLYCFIVFNQFIDKITTVAIH